MPIMKMQSKLALCAPFLVVFGISSIVCAHPTGALQRIRRSFADSHTLH